MYKYILIFGFFFFAGHSLKAQSQDSLVQFSGMILDGTDENLYPIPFANILVKSKNRGTYSDDKGFFSLVVVKGDIIVFSSIGYKSIEFTIPDTLKANRYSLVQLMSQDTFNLPETIVFPWPSREHFKTEFLALDITEELQELAMSNLAEENLREQRSEVPTDPGEHASYYLRQTAKEYYHIGQNPPMNIYSPLAWKKFFDAWKNGDFKNKNKKKTKRFN